MGTWHNREGTMALIRSARDAEEAARAWMVANGWSDATLTNDGADGGVDVHATGVVAQVKAEVRPIGRPPIQAIRGIAAYEDATALFFSIGGYTAEALAWGTDAGVAMFGFDLQGDVVPANAVADNIGGDGGSAIDFIEDPAYQALIVRLDHIPTVEPFSEDELLDAMYPRGWPSEAIVKHSGGALKMFADMADRRGGPWSHDREFSGVLERLTGLTGGMHYGKGSEFSHAALARILVTLMQLGRPLIVMTIVKYGTIDNLAFQYEIVTAASGFASARVTVMFMSKADVAVHGDARTMADVGLEFLIESPFSPDPTMPVLDTSGGSAEVQDALPEGWLLDHQQVASWCVAWSGAILDRIKGEEGATYGLPGPFLWSVQD